MAQTVTRCRVEVLVDMPLARKVADIANSVGVTGYTLIPTLGGAGRGGSWSDDQIAGADSKIWFLTVTSELRAQAFVDALSPLLDSHGLMVMTGSVEVVRGDRF